MTLDDNDIIEYLRTLTPKQIVDLVAGSTKTYAEDEEILRLFAIYIDECKERGLA